MGITGCSAINCTTNTKWNRDLSFFRFPKDPKRLKLWLQACRRLDIMKVTTDYAYKNLRLCSKHFTDSCFMNTVQRNSLVWDAVPSLFDVPNPPPSRYPKRKAPTPRCLAPSLKKRKIVDWDEHEISVAKAVDVAREVPGFGEVSGNEIQAINAEGNEESPKGIVSALNGEDHIEESAGQPATDNETMVYTRHQLRLILASAEQFKRVVLEIEPSHIKKLEFKQQLTSLVKSYRDFYNEHFSKRKQALRTRCLQSRLGPSTVPKPGPSSEPQSGPSSDTTDKKFDGFMREVEELQGVKPLQTLQRLTSGSLSTGDSQE